VPKRIRQEVHEYSLHLFGCEARGDIVSDFRSKRDVARTRLGLDAAEAARNHRRHREPVHLERESPGIDACELEEVVDEQREYSHLLAQHREVLLGLAQTILERLEHRLHVGEGRAEVVARPRDELATGVEEATEVRSHLVE
jgi:hypothetical protein